MRSLEPLDGPEPVTLTRVRLAREGHGSEGEAAEGTAGGRRTALPPACPRSSAWTPRADVLRSASEVFGLEAVACRTRRGGGPRRRRRRAAAELGPEVMVRTLVRPDRPIPEHRRATRAVYRLSLEGGEPMPALPDGGAQRVERAAEGGGGDRLRVTADTGRRRRRRSRGPGDRRPPSSSLYLDHEDPGPAPAPPGRPDPVDADPESLRPAGARRSAASSTATSAEGPRHRLRHRLRGGPHAAGRLHRARGAARRPAAGRGHPVAGGHRPRLPRELRRRRGGVRLPHVGPGRCRRGPGGDGDAARSTSTPRSPGASTPPTSPSATPTWRAPTAATALDRMLPLVGKLRIEVVEVETAGDRYAGRASARRTAASTSSGE